MFLAPFLFVVHAILTGVAFVIMNALNVRLGFGFSAGLFDYVLNFSRATHPLMLLPVGALYFGLYYGLFRVVIVKLNLKTPGRDANEGSTPAPAVARCWDRAVGYIAALGGAGQPSVSVGTLAYERRLSASWWRARSPLVNEGALKALGARGVVRPSPTALQVVIGGNADQVAGEIRDALKAGVTGAEAGTVSVLANTPAVTNTSGAAPTTTTKVAVTSNTDTPDGATIERLLAALGGRTNVRAVEAAASRLRISVLKSSAVDAAAIRSLGLRGVTVPSPDCVHVIVGPAASVTSAGLRRLIA